MEPSVEPVVQAGEPLELVLLPDDPEVDELWVEVDELWALDELMLPDEAPDDDELSDAVDELEVPLLVATEDDPVLPVEDELLPLLFPQPTATAMPHNTTMYFMDPPRGGTGGKWAWMMSARTALLPKAPIAMAGGKSPG